MKKILVTLFSLVLILSLTACGSSNQENSNTATQKEDTKQGTSKDANQTQAVTLDLATGNPGGSFYPVGVAIANILKKNASDKIKDVTILPGTSDANIIQVHKGQVDLGFSFGSAAYEAWQGIAPFGTPQKNFTQLFSVMKNYGQWITLPGSSIKSINDLRGKRVNVATIGQSSNTTAMLILKAYGITEKDLSKAEHLNYDDAIDQLGNKQLDAIFWQADLPFAPFISIAETTGLKIIPLDDDKIKILTDANKGYAKAILPANSYKGQTEDIPTVMSTINIGINRNLDENLTYEITKIVSEHLDELRTVVPALKTLKPEDLALDIGIDFHPGALKYYKEQGWIK